MGVDFALLGCRHPHSAAHLNTLRASPAVERFWLWDPDPDAAHALAADAGPRLAGVGSCLEDILDTPARFALVCRQNDDAPDTLVAAARAGKHVLTEKPGARTAAELLPALRAATAANVSLGVYYCWRSHPAAAKLREIIAGGAIGYPMAVEARMVTSHVRFRDPSHWLFSREKGGGGILHWLACHWVDLLRFILGDEVTHLSALGGTLTGTPIDVEDTAAVTMRFGSGAIGTLTAGYHLSRSTAGYTGASYDTFITIRGSLGQATWIPVPGPGPVVVQGIGPGYEDVGTRTFEFLNPPAEGYGGAHGVDFFHRWIDDARAGRRPLASGEDALRTLEWLDAAYQSMESGSLACVDAAALP